MVEISEAHPKVKKLKTVGHFLPATATTKQQPHAKASTILMVKMCMYMLPGNLDTLNNRA